MSRVHWLTRSAGEVPEDNGWLSAGEAAVARGLRVPKRERDWLLGRWTAKQALASHLEEVPDLTRLEIRAAADGAPEAFLDGEPLPLTLSLSHTAGQALCTLLEGGALGCDLERVESRSEFFVEDYFTAAEQEQVAGAAEADLALYENLIWSAKESALKALRVGLRADTRSVEVSLPETDGIGGWRRLEVRQVASGAVFSGWWRRTDALVMTVVSDVGVGEPVALGWSGGRSSLFT